MGRGKKKGKRQRSSTGGEGEEVDSKGWRKEKKPRDDRDQTGWRRLVNTNEKFNEYYKKNEIVPENEWDAFITSLQSTLPVTFRITEGTMFSNEIKKSIESKFLNSGKVIKSVEGVEIEPPKPIPWYPNNGAWVMKASRKDFRKTPELDEFHKFIITQTEYGNVFRQEAVSMIPPLFLGIKSHHRVLDMCAAPGSKTMQMMGFMQADAKEDEPPTGLVVANDIDTARCFLLIHQIKRLGSPSTIITNHPGHTFPYIKHLPDPKTNPEFLEGMNREGKVSFQFDRILCDVPCSGDGTLRKSPDLWVRWNPTMGLGLHRTQVMIATRAVHLLKVGGRMVYSTCSLNPVEDEASVAELLRRFKGSLQLVDVSSQFPELIRSKGINTWKIQDRRGNWYSSFSEINFKNKNLFPSTFPPTEEEVKEFHLDRCMRILPHAQDTGGFFIAVLEKTAPSWRNEGEPPKETDATTTSDSTTVGDDTKSKDEVENKNENKEEVTTTANKMEVDQDEKNDLFEDENKEKDEAEKKSIPKVSRHQVGKIEPYMPFPKELLPVWEKLANFFGIRSNFPVNQLMIRSATSPKIYFLSPGSIEFFKADEKGQVKIENAGVKLFVDHDAKGVEVNYRISQEGINCLLPYLEKRVARVTEEEMKILLTKKDPMLTEFSLETQKQLLPMLPGSCVFTLGKDSKSFPGLAVAGWKGKMSVHLQIAKEEIAALKKLFVSPEEEKLTSTSTSTSASTTTSTSNVNENTKTEST